MLIATSGCLARARRQVYGSIRAAGRDMVLINAAFYLSRQWKASREWRAADQAWSECMRRFGYHVGSMDDLVIRVDKAYTAHGKPAITAAGIATERRAAIATARCERATNVIAGHLEAEIGSISRLPLADLKLLVSAATDARAVGAKYRRVGHRVMLNKPALNRRARPDKRR